jgi:hypothetical protein
MPLHRNASTKFGKKCPRASLVAQNLRIGIESHGQHPAADVAANERGIDQLPRGNGQSDTHVLSAVHVRHDGDMTDIIC